MDLFSITCTTCKSRLRVRDEGAIGQILSCPKCHGMVMVKAPEGWEPGKPLPPPRPEPVAGITAVVEVKKTDDTSSDANFDAIDEILENAPPKPKKSIVSVAPDAPGLARPRFAGNPHLPPAAAPAIGRNSQAVASASSVNAVVEPPVVARDSKPDPAADAPANGGEPMPDFRPPQSRPWRTYLGLAASVFAGVGLAIAVVVASANFFRGEPKQTAQTGTPNPAASPGQQTIPTHPAETTPSDSTTTKPAEPVTPTPQPPEVRPQPSTTPSSTSPTEPSTPATEPVQPAPRPKANSPFDPILEPEPDPLAPKTEQPATKPVAPPPGEPMDDETPAKPTAPRPEPREVDVAARLADPLAALETDGTPLADFLQVMSELSTIPITLEPDALPLAQANAASPVVLKLSSTTVGAALTAGLSRLGLEHVPTDGHVIVRLIEPEEMKVLTYPHKDLTSGDPAVATELAELIQAVVDSPSWTLGEAGATIAVEETLKIKQRRANHAQIFLLCEKLRTARKLPHASKYPPALFQLDSRTKQATAKLKTPITANFHQPTPLVKLLAHLEQAGGVRILVDWRDIAAGGWNPDAMATLVVEKETLALALAKLLEPLDLAWRVVDGQTIQVVTPATLSGRKELELFAVGDVIKDDPTGQHLVAELRETLGAGLFLDQGGPCELRFDVAGQCLIASLPQPKQQDLEAFLIGLRRPQ
jgi:hypothetical protein